MAGIYQKMKVSIYTTPAELRELADELEAKWQEAKLGYDTPSKLWDGKEAEVAFLCDQARMPQNKNGVGVKRG